MPMSGCRRRQAPGKTFVLAARVLRLLLQPSVRPESILCLTFTRAGAAEMSERVHSRLANWARMAPELLQKELFALGEDHSPAAVARARTLFAHVLDSRGGGLRVMTIHAFCQTLLGTFPLEAGLSPGFRAIEGRDQAALAARTLAELATQAESEGDARLIAALRALSLRLGEEGARGFLTRSAKRLSALESLPDGIEARVRGALGVPLGFDATHITDRCCDDSIDRQSLLDLADMQAAWSTKTGDKAVDTVSNWLLGTPEQRAARARHACCDLAHTDRRFAQGRAEASKLWRDYRAAARLVQRTPGTEGACRTGERHLARALRGAALCTRLCRCQAARRLC